MRNGQVYAFYGNVQKIERHRNGRDCLILLTDLAKDNGALIIDYIWVDLPRNFEPIEIRSGSILRFEAFVKEFETRSYYDYHERETVQLRPVCKLTDLSNIIIE